MRGHNLNVALIHWPVLNKARDVVATNVTNFDIHDIARASRTYGVGKYFIVNTIEEQLIFVNRMLDHWRIGPGARLNPMRQTALGMIQLAETLDVVLNKHYSEEKPQIIATAARDFPGVERCSFRELRQDIFKDKQRARLLLFGTGFGLDEQILKKCDLILEPIKGASMEDYRHLSVRSAVSICLDRLFGAW
ncbi:MAG: RNA methyltransferase [Bdellovibrionaceae bacterium]|nr:RNA methyltransferase [Pseudobdellovibrionaceae bacterium]